MMKKNLLLTFIFLLIIFFTRDYTWTRDYWMRYGLFISIANMSLIVIPPLFNAYVFVRYLDFSVVKKIPLLFMLLISLISTATSDQFSLVIIIFAILFRKAFALKNKKEKYLALAMIVAIILIISLSIYLQINQMRNLIIRNN